MKIKSSIRDYQVKFSDALDLNFDYYLIDQAVYKLYYESFKHIDEKRIVCIIANEKNKSYLKCAYYIEKLINAGIKRGNTLCAIGGGVTQDIAGFISSILYRGIDWVFYPTTLLSQCDSCIGGKTSINLCNFKNIIGNFNPPKIIKINTNFLATLKEEEIQSGLGEIIKVAFLDSKHRIDYNVLIDCINNNKVPTSLIKLALQIKKEIIEIDEFDKGLRNIMNYGHTFGHAIEAITRFEVPHGIAVGIGIDIANKITKSLFENNSKEIEAVINSFLKKNKRYVEIFKNVYNEDRFIQILKKDKKNTDSETINCILSNIKGNTIKKNLSIIELKLIFAKIFSQ